jgi:hypothetical protein
MIEPTTRREMFLHAIATGCECELEPVTREEMLLAQHAQREASGGSGGSGGGGGVTVALFRDEYGTVSCNKSYAECVEAFNNGTLIACADLGKSYYPRIFVEEIEDKGSSLLFTFIAGINKNQPHTFNYYADGTIQHYDLSVG